MINLNTYITEKFKITKKTKGVSSFEKDDLMVRFCFYEYSSGRTLFEVGGHGCKPYKFGEIKNNRFYFWSDFNDSYTDFYDYEDKVFINDKGFYEVSGSTPSTTKSKTLYLDKDTSIELLKKIKEFYPESVNENIDCSKIVNVLKDYFDTNTILPKKFIVERARYSLETLIKDLNKS